MKETREETYRKVIISDADDLPKVSGWYDTNLGSHNYCYSPANDEWWLDQIEWYYEPVTDKEATTEKEKPQTAEADTDDVQEFMNDVHKWADDTFGKERTALAPLHHLKKEVDEAISEMKKGFPGLAMKEIADCFILILNTTSKYGYTFEQLLTEAKNKMIINKARKWGKPDTNGVVEHIQAEAEKEVSDEDIEKWIAYMIFHHRNWFDEESAREGIKAMRDNLIKKG